MVSDQQAVGLQKILPALLVLCNIPNLPEQTLDLLAFQYQVLFYSSTFTITDPVQRLAAKRQLMANNFNFHAHLGTPATVQQIVTQAYGPAIVQEWFQYGGIANHFRILLPTNIGPVLQAEILQLVNVVKRASQAFDGFFQFTAAPSNLYVAVGVYTQIWLMLPMPTVLPTGRNYVTMGASVFAMATVNRSSAVVQINTGGSVTPSARQWVAGANICDIRMYSGVAASLRNLASALAQINLRGTVATPLT
jgi:P2-related tail formation protein